MRSLCAPFTAESVAKRYPAQIQQQQRYARTQVRRTRGEMDEHTAECMTCSPHHECSIMQQICRAHDRAKQRLDEYVTPGSTETEHGGDER